MENPSRIDREKNRAAMIQFIDEHCDENRVKAFEQYVGIDFATYRGGAERASLSHSQQERMLEVIAEIMRKKHAARKVTQ